MIHRKSKRTVEGGLQVGREEFLKARPVRNPELKAEEDEKGLHLRVPRKQTLWFKLFSKVLPLNKEQRVLLDEQGALVWSLCDGEHQVKEIAKRLSEKYEMRVSDAQAALDLYLVQLSKSGLVGFVLPESASKRYHKSMSAQHRKSVKKSRE